jgi:hypothetical protein
MNGGLQGLEICPAIWRGIWMTFEKFVDVI